MYPHAPHALVADDTEERRIAALRALDLLDSAPEPEFDAIADLAATLLGAPFAAVTLVDRDRVWVKAKVGLVIDEERRETTFCHHAIESDDMLVVPDANADDRFEARCRAFDGHPIRFYAGVPIHAPSGERIGALCVGAPSPRALADSEGEGLRQLALLVDVLIAARATAREAIEIAGESARQAEHLRRQERVMHQAERLAMIGSWRLTLADDSIEWSDNTFRIHGLAVGEVPGVDQALDFYPPHARAIVAQALAATIETGVSMDVEVDFLNAKLAQRRVRSIGELECQNGRPVAVVGVFQDVTERWTLEQTLRRSADRDELTGIANRAAFNRILEAALEDAGIANTPLLLALIDLDGFKLVNDTFGHLAGDDILKAVGRRLERSWLNGSFAARLGGDEFALIVTDRGLTSDPNAFAARLEAELHVPVVGTTAFASGTVGAALLEPADTIRDLVHRADTILYAAKRARAGERRQAERRAR